MTIKLKMPKIHKLSFGTKTTYCGKRYLSRDEYVGGTGVSANCEKCMKAVEEVIPASDKSLVMSLEEFNRITRMIEASKK